MEVFIIHKRKKSAAGYTIHTLMFFVESSAAELQQVMMTTFDYILGQNSTDREETKVSRTLPAAFVCPPLNDLYTLSSWYYILVKGALALLLANTRWTSKGPKDKLKLSLVQLVLRAHKTKREPDYGCKRSNREKSSSSTAIFSLVFSIAKTSTSTSTWTSVFLAGAPLLLV